MKIAIDARYLDGQYSGIATYSERLITAISEIDKENQYVIIVHSGYNKPLNLGKNFEIIKIPKRPLSFWTIFGQWKFLKKLNIDIFHAHFPILPLFYNGKNILTLHDLQPFTDPLFSAMRSAILVSAYDIFYRWIYPLSIRKTKWVISVSSKTKDDLEKLIPHSQDKTIVIHSGIEEKILNVPGEDFIKKTKDKFCLHDNYFFYIGSTRPNKNIPNMLKAFAMLRENNRDFDDLKFILCLSNVDRFFDMCYFVAERLKLKINQDIFIYKNVTDDEKKVLYLLSKFFCFPTKYEGFGLPILEAQALKVPVLASDSGASKEIAGDGALLVNPDDPDEIANGMRLILTNSNLRNALVEEGKRNIQRFSWKITAGKVIDIYKYLA